MMKRILLYAFVSVISFSSFAQEAFPVNGVVDDRLEIYAFTNATIYVNPTKKLENATLVIKNGKVLATGNGISIPEGAIVTDLAGKTIYPGFVDPYSDYGMPEVKQEGFNWMAPPQTESNKKGPYSWNEAIKSEINAAEVFSADRKKAESLRKAGFGTVIAHHQDGIARGSSALIALSANPEQHAVIQDKVSGHYSLSRGSSKQTYPNSIMGAVALLRQTHYDAIWYKSAANQEQLNLSLAAYNDLQKIPSVFESTDQQRTQVVAKVGKELGIKYIIKGTGDEYQALDDFKASGLSFILPVNFPDAYDVEDPYDALNVSLAQLKHWELAPKNPAFFAAKGIPFAFTASGLKNTDDFLKNVRKAVQYGLSETDALNALTIQPASLMKVQDKVGSLDNGKVASFIITSGNIFDDKTKIHENWVQGSKFVISAMDALDFAGNYDLSVDGKSYKLEISGAAGDHKAKVKLTDTTSVDVKMKLDGYNVTMSFDPDKSGDLRLSGFFTDKKAMGKGQKKDGTWISWNADYKSAIEDKSDAKAKTQEEIKVGDILYPFVAFGTKEKLKPETMLIKNATVWTNESDGKLESADVLVRNGKIAAVGKDLTATDAKIIDGKGMHLTSGIIDEHTHAGLASVNEGSQANTAEVRMEDAIDAGDMDIYRQLAGGVTAAQQLHGSANPIGGQSSLIKFRWGETAESMKIKGADGFIKFALGENVKQSNRSNAFTTRFPQTRMGVEQVFEDAFSQSLAYEKEWKTWNGLPVKIKAVTPAPRRDLELETMSEIMNKKRFVSCHSYVQSEINMLIQLADRYGVTINTFTHILEGYKVADKMAEHGAGGSSFADWWAYKFEVRESIPYNAALMNMAGVTTAINSDDAEMARRLNQEAAKTVKYGGVSEEEAWKMVTLNPAKLLHLDDRMGSIKVGKDADLVLWTDHPLSIYARVNKTIIDGTVYFDSERDLKLRAEVNAERARIIAKMRESKAGGAPTRKPSAQMNHMWECEDVADYMGMEIGDQH
jgi:imidazolonepropionase-like amidohydrolase